MLLGVLAIAGLVAYFFRTDPIGPISGKSLSGQEVVYSISAPICLGEDTIALESRLNNPHSVTALCFPYGDSLMVLALRGAEKEWTGYVSDDSSVRIKSGGVIYRANALRVEHVSLPSVADSIGRKYPNYADRMTQSALADAWYFELVFQ